MKKTYCLFGFCRSKQWVKACDRNDLLEKTPIELFNSYRVCAKHFTNSMFLNDLRNRLQPNSVPMQLEPPEELEDLSDEIDKNKDELSESPDPVAKILSNCVLRKFLSIYEAPKIIIKNTIYVCDFYTFRQLF